MDEDMIALRQACVAVMWTSRATREITTIIIASALLSADYPEGAKCFVVRSRNRTSLLSVFGYLDRVYWYKRRCVVVLHGDYTPKDWIIRQLLTPI
jgi:hypothetical protein